jgi:hypothetical protein
LRSSDAAFLGHTVISESVYRRAATRDSSPARSAWRSGVERCPCNRARSTKATPPVGLPTRPSRDSNGYTLPLRCTPSALGRARSKKRCCHSVPVSRRERLIRLVAPSLMASVTRYRQRMARMENGMPVVREEHQAVRRNRFSARRSAITCAKLANSELERCRRRGKTRQVMMNHRSDSPRRRRRDMGTIITVGSHPRIQDSRSPTKSRRGTLVPLRYLLALGRPTPRAIVLLVLHDWR